MTVKLNKDSDKVAEVRAAVKANNGYCPCSLIKDERHKCMCCDFKEQEEEGLCLCGLYYKSAN